MSGDPLGRRVQLCALSIRGQKTEAEWKALLNDIAASLGMTAIADPAVWSYPIDGKGGFGQTMVQPITESFIALDTWPDHDGAYLFVCSCRTISGDALGMELARAGLSVIAKTGSTLSLA